MPASAGRSLWPAILGGWALAAIVLIAAGWTSIVQRLLPDPDDIMRLLEVRDLVAGQSWWDVSQHRLASGMMHWSRLVDLPIAGVLLILRPILGQARAEDVALVLVPLTTLLTVMALVAHLTRRLLDDDHARLALLITPLSVPLLFQLRPLRIDHHGWQIALALAALLAFVQPGRSARSGAVGGLAIATLLTISLEGLPIAAALLALLVAAYLVDHSWRPRLIAAVWSAAIGAALLHAATRGPLMLQPACDAMSPVWLALLGVAATGVSIATQVRGRGLALAILGATAIACVAALLAIDPRCTQGPFEMLPPIVRTLWYQQVSEGLPIWRQPGDWAIMTVSLPIIGLAGSIYALQGADRERRLAWCMMLGALGFAFLLSLLVNRVGATANAFAVPGASTVVLALLSRARRIRPVVPRIAATAAALLSAAPAIAAIAIVGPFTRESAAQPARSNRIQRPLCTSERDVRALRLLPPGLLYAPIDISPEIILTTGHRAITSAHHRNARALADILSTFTGSPEAAYLTLARYGAAYLVVCPGLNETALYTTVAPNGFWARLERGERFDWLQPVPIKGSPVLAWHVVPVARPLSNATAAR